MTATHITFQDVFRERAALAPDKRAYTFLGDGEQVSATLTYRELDAQARVIAAALQQHGAGRGRALLLYPPGLDFVGAFMGCLYAGVTAIPAYPPHPTRLERTLPRLLSIVADAGPVAVLTTGKLLDGLARSRPLPAPLEALSWIGTDLPGSPGAPFREPGLGSDAVAFLQYTSGSTSDPKGVMVTHANLLHNETLIQRAFRHDASTVVVGWLPLYHDMGLIGNLLQPIFLGGSCIMMPPLAFLQQPIRWLRAVSAFRATTSGGPNFAYELCTRKVTEAQRATLDLGGWHIAFNGAEPVRAETLARFAEAFQPCGFRRSAFLPCYGLAEGTLYVSGDERRDLGAELRDVDARALGANLLAPAAAAADARSLVGCGQSPPEQEVVVVDPDTLHEAEDGRVGEIWVAGPSVAAGYWNRPEATAQTFGARLPDGRGPFLRTGDLGFLSDGQLFVTGRQKDLIVIRGQNYYPQDIELTAEDSHPAIMTAGAAAFSVEADDGEQLVVLVEVNRRYRAAGGGTLDLPDILRAIRLAVTDEHQLQPWAVLALDASSIPKTSSGKVRRHLCRRMFLEGGFEALAEWRFAETPADTPQTPRTVEAPAREAATPDVEAIRAWLIAELSGRLRVPASAIDIREPFASYGLDSKEAAILSGSLEVWLGRSLTPTLAYEYPTIEKLARHLAGDPAPLAVQSPDAARTPGDAVAIIGIGCRFPGADGPAAFWSLLRGGVDAITEVPPERWAIDELYDPDRTAAGRVTTRWGGFLRDVDQFDPQFFGIAPREAARMDPQQRVILEVAWSALEDAGQTRERTAGTRTGVFLGISTADYSRMQMADRDAIDAYVGTGSAFSVAANRLSYLMDWRGPSLAVDTACSSSLVALHLACDSLLSGESTLALAGGVNLILAPDVTINFSRAGVMSPDGRCKAFDAGANGYVRSEGAGIVVLKPLSRALADHDPIYAVVRGTAVGQDGRTNGLMAPSREAQEDVVRRAYQRAGILPGRADYVEAHGTGTLLGDPIEAAALGAVMAEGRAPGAPCAIGSVKTNIGHTEAAAGIAGVIKVALSLRHGQIPPSLHFQTANPHIPFDRLPLRVQSELSAWPERPTPHVAGVSSFGFGGANAHVVLEAAPASPEMAPAAAEVPSILPLSGHNAEALRGMAEAWRRHLASDTLEGIAHADVCAAAAHRCHHHDHRLAIVSRTRGELGERLDAYLAGEARPGMIAGRASARQHKVVFVFPGQGSQWHGMGRELYRHQPVFREALDRCDAAIEPIARFSVRQVLLDDADLAARGIDVVQPVLFAVEVALAALWRSFGVEPAAVVGHSMGEVAAAQVAGILSLDDAAAVICHRSLLLRSVGGRGAMALVELTREEAAAAIAGLEDRLAIAVSNSPRSTVLSGDPEALQQVTAALDARDVFCSPINVDVASHSPQMDPLCPPLRQALEGITPSAAAIPMLSTVAGGWLDGASAGAGYWVRNLREPVLFAGAVAELIDQGYDTFVEVSPHPVLLIPMEEALKSAGRGAMAVASCRRHDDWALLAGVAALHTTGHPIRWETLGGPPSGRHVPLPPPAWQRQRYWFNDAPAAASAGPASGAVRELTLGRPAYSALHPGTLTWDLQLSSKRPRYVVDHQVRGTVVVPATLYADVALQAAAAVEPGAHPELEEFEFIEMLPLDRETETTCQVALVVAEERARFQFFSRDADGAWKVHARGTIALHPPGVVPGFVSGERPADIVARCPEALDGARHYEALSTRGLEYGPAFRLLDAVWRGEREAIGQLKPGPRPAAGARRLHPAVMDAGMHVIAAAAAAEGSDTYVPVSIASVVAYGTAEGPLWSHARLTEASESGAPTLVADVTFLDDGGRVVVEARGIRMRRVGASRRPPQDVADWFYELEWKPRSVAPFAAQEADVPVEAPGRPWLMFADGGGVGEMLASLLEARGEPCVLVFAGDDHGAQARGRTVLIDPDAAAVGRLLADAEHRGAGYGGVIHLWSLDYESLQPTLDELRAAQQVICQSAWRIVQALAGLDLPSPPRLWLVTSGAMSVAGQQEPVALAQAPLWGLANTAAHEHPELRCTRIDLSDAATREEIEALVTEVHAAAPEDRVALRDDIRYVGRLVPAARPLRILRYASPRRKVLVNGRPVAHRAAALQERRSQARLDPDAIYLVTGGLGGLGLAVARWLERRGARHLALSGRSAPSPQAEAVLQELRRAGTRVTVVSADIADRERTAAMLEALDADGRPLRGVIHAAGVLDDGLLLHMDWARFQTTLGPKLDGAWNLHELTLDRPLDFFVLFSSVASVLGSPGQANYAAANAFLDALAYYRRALGLPALSINWGPWEEVGLAATQPERARREAERAGLVPEPSGERPLLDRLALRGLDSFSPEQGIEILEQLMLRSGPQVAVLPIDWQQFAAFYPGFRTAPSFSLFHDAGPAASGPTPADAEPVARPGAWLHDQPQEQWQALIEDRLHEQVARTLGLSPAAVDRHQPLTALGLDSLMAVELKNWADVHVGIVVPVRRFLRGPSIAQFAAELRDALRDRAGAASGVRV
ncbi:MAG: type I polyketide synthase [Acidobacteriota bacterium]